jgi:hypothetical protein
MSNRNAEQRLLDALNVLPREVLPQRDLWPGIAHGLLMPEPRPVAWYRHAALAASVVLVLTLSLYYGTLQPLQPLPNSRVEALLSSLKDEHQLNKQTMLVQYQGQEAYSPDWESDLQEMEQAEAVIFEALRNDPENLQLIKMLRQVQENQLDLIDAVFDPRVGTI